MAAKSIRHHGSNSQTALSTSFAMWFVAATSALLARQLTGNPQSKIYKMTPTDQQSTFSSYGLPSRISGATYPGVLRRKFREYYVEKLQTFSQFIVSAQLWHLFVSRCTTHPQAVAIMSLSRTSLASPKSAILIVASSVLSVYNKFSGLQIE
jgi:hypothetical protein